MPNDHVFSGCMPALMTPCQSDRSPNLDALVDKGRSLIAAGMTSSGLLRIHGRLALAAR